MIFGVNVIESKFLPYQHDVHCGHWLDGYALSKNRSPRLVKKLTSGTRNKPPVTRRMYETVTTHAIFMNGQYLMSAESISSIRSQTNVR